jgi:hypothetical protein
VEEQDDGMCSLRGNILFAQFEAAGQKGAHFRSRQRQNRAAGESIAYKSEWIWGFHEWFIVHSDTEIA